MIIDDDTFPDVLLKLGIIIILITFMVSTIIIQHKFKTKIERLENLTNLTIESYHEQCFNSTTTEKYRVVTENETIKNEIRFVCSSFAYYSVDGFESYYDNCMDKWKEEYELNKPYIEWYNETTCTSVIRVKEI